MAFMSSMLHVYQAKMCQELFDQHHQEISIVKRNRLRHEQLIGYKQNDIEQKHERCDYKMPIVDSRALARNALQVSRLLSVVVIYIPAHQTSLAKLISYCLP